MNRQINNENLQPLTRFSNVTRVIVGLILLTGILLSLNYPLQAQTSAKSEIHKIYLSHHEFEAWTFTPQPNDWIHIVNHSDIAHSIYITSPDGSITNLDVQLPGATVRWQVPDSGDYSLQCWIHPVIHATLSVKTTTSLSKR